MKSTDLIIDEADKALIIDQDELNNELMDQPLLMRKWTKLKAKVVKKCKVISLELKRKEAQVHLQYTESGGRVKDIESKVELHPEVMKLKMELIDAEELVEEYEGIIRAVYQRHESLKEVCANMRKELAE